MALIVEVHINSRTIAKLGAVRIKGEVGEFCEYEVRVFNSCSKKWETFDRIIVHHYNDGGHVLAIKLLEIGEELRLQRKVEFMKKIEERKK